VTGPTTIKLRIARNLSMNVLLSKVFLDPADDGDSRLAPASSLWDEWAARHARHLSSAAEQKAFMAAVRHGELAADDTMPLLSRFAACALSARQYGLAVWAAEAKSRALTDRPKALKRHLRDTVAAFNTASEVRAPIPLQAVIPSPFVEKVFADYLDAEAEGLSATRLEALLRRTAQAREKTDPALARIAYERFIATVGRAGLASEDHYRMTFVAEAPVEDTRRLERVLSAH
jgi:hypothetical protein